ncbi:MAG: sulfur carrier protein ThiS [Gammaproteobacteria bacterium]
MEIIVNGQARQVVDGLRVSALLEMLELSGRRLAIEVNREIVPRSRFATQQLQAGDQVEIVQAIGGG